MKQINRSTGSTSTSGYGPFAGWLGSAYVNHRWVHLVVGCVLLFAAFSKWLALKSAPVTDFLLQATLLEMEFLLGVMLLLGVAPLLMGRIALCVFAAFAMASVGKILVGSASCGCFGEVDVSPWYSLSLNLVVMGFLIGVPPARHHVPLGRYSL